MKKIIQILSVVAMFISTGVFAQDFGDNKSVTLTSKAWNALNTDAGLAIVYADKCTELYMAKAKEMQKSLGEFAGEDTASSYWALNDVGTCLFIKGQALIKQGRTNEALEAFKLLTSTLSYAQCWDSNGWFWRPADAAKEKIIEMEFDAE
ncbi:MAG: hypothetical protein MK132_18270 [Lentisphaerales bacterium]|nr:hypothetical protein [Lentisphaerales bacterium]